MPEITPARAALGCSNLVTILAGFGAGFYYGAANSKGTDVNPQIRNLLLYGPSVLNGILGYFSGADFASDPKMQEEVDRNAAASGIPDEVRKQAAGCRSGCAPIGCAVSGLGITALFTYIGYTIGKSVNP